MGGEECCREDVSGGGRQRGGEDKQIRDEKAERTSSSMLTSSEVEQVASTSPKYNQSPCLLLVGPAVFPSRSSIGRALLSSLTSISRSSSSPQPPLAALSTLSLFLSNKLGSLTTSLSLSLVSANDSEVGWSAFEAR